MVCVPLLVSVYLVIDSCVIMSILSDALCEWWPLPAALGIVYLIFHSDGLTEQSLYTFEVETAVAHAFNGTVERNDRLI